MLRAPSQAKKEPLEGVDLRDWDALYSLAQQQAESRHLLREKVRELRAKGWTWQMLADVLDMHMPTLRRQFFHSDYGISVRPTKRWKE